ncbi:hypothetical protein P0Y35_08735 [Kiritimatiellaeota bacterium B1221]|nr:hypothetical protein [Kiritimatiellaeota bacterium B1221]
MSAVVSNPSGFLKVLYDDLKALVEPMPGRVFMARDPYHALELLVASPAAFFCVVLDKGDAPDQHGPVVWLNQQVGIFVAQNRGLEVDESKTLLSLTERCELVRDRVLSKVYPAATSEQHPKYQGKNLVTLPDGMPLSAYELNFSLRLAGSNITYRSE